MPRINSNDIQIEYETIGNQSSPAVLLIYGFAGQLIMWHDTLCQKIAEQGFYVIRFDNRDAGLSTKCEEAGGPADIMSTIKAIMMGESITPPYTIEDMADDAVGLLDALGIENAHICGMSMGGMIAQSIAVRYPYRALSLISIYSETGNTELPPPQPRAMKFLNIPTPQERAGYIEHFVQTWRTFAGTGLPFDEEFHRKLQFSKGCCYY